MRNLALSFFLISILNSSFLFSQSKLSMAPGIGFLAHQFYVKENKFADKGFRVNNLAIITSFNLSLQLDIKTNWLIFAGAQANKDLISWKYGCDAGSRAKSLKSINSMAISFPIGIHKYIHTHRWLKTTGRSKVLNDIVELFLNNPKTPRSNHYFILFRSKFISGFSYDIKDLYGNSYSSGARPPTNYSIFLGLGLQFFSDHKDRLQLTILYSQGCKETASIDVEYFMDGKIYSGKIGSRGSFFTAQMAYPIRLLNL